MKMILSIVHPVVIVAAATVFFAAGGGALCRAEGAAQNSATPLLSGGNPDPTICRVGDYYYIATSSFSLSPGLPVYSSTDMVNWQIVSHAWRESWPCKTPADRLVHILGDKRLPVDGVKLENVRVGRVAKPDRIENAVNVAVDRR